VLRVAAQVLFPPEARGHHRMAAVGEQVRKHVACCRSRAAVAGGV
jgi:hypothetical protein